jgi:hypothetical protein
MQIPDRTILPEIMLLSLWRDVQRNRESKRAATSGNLFSTLQGIRKVDDSAAIGGTNTIASIDVRCHVH